MSSSTEEMSFTITGEPDTLPEFFTEQTAPTIGLESELQFRCVTGWPMDNRQQAKLRATDTAPFFTPEACAQMVEVKTGVYRAADAEQASDDVQAQRKALHLAARHMQLQLSPDSILQGIPINTILGNIYDNPRCRVFLRYFAASPDRHSIGHYFSSVSGDQISIGSRDQKECWDVFKTLAFLLPYFIAVSHNAPAVKNDHGHALNTSRLRVSASTFNRDDLGLPWAFWQSDSGNAFAETFNRQIWDTSLFSYHNQQGALIAHPDTDHPPTLHQLPKELRTYKNFKHASSIQWSLLTLSSIEGAPGQANQGRRIELRAMDAQNDPHLRSGLVALSAAIADDEGIRRAVNDVLDAHGLRVDSAPQASKDAYNTAFEQAIKAGDLCQGDFRNMAYGRRRFSNLAAGLTPILAGINGRYGNCDALIEYSRQGQSPTLRKWASTLCPV